MTDLDVKNTCRLLDLANQDILGQINVLSGRIGYKTQFLDHSTIYAWGKSSEYMVILDQNDLDGIASILKACSICREKKIAFVITETKDIFKYDLFFSKAKVKYFLIRHPEPNIVLLGYNGIIRFSLRIFTNSTLTKQIQRLSEFEVSQHTFLEMTKSQSFIHNVFKDKESTHVLFNISFNILESYTLIVQKYKLLIKELFPGQLDLDWTLEYVPWYDFSLGVSNRVKRGSLHLSSTKLHSMSETTFHDFFKLSNYGTIICFNYTPDGDRFGRIEETAKLYRYLSH